MKLTKRFSLIMMGAIVMVLFGCSSDKNQYSPDQVIKNALEKTTSLESYYAEVDMIIKENDEVIEEIQMKEWQADNGHRRIETENKDGTDLTIAVSDGKTLTTYLVDENQVLTLDGEGMFNQSQQSLKDQVFFYLETMRETYEIEVVGADEVVDRKAHHFIAKPKKAGTLLGEQEIWIDQENWRVLKTIIINGDTKVEMVYTKFDPNEKISDDLFELDIPEDAEIQNLDDENLDDIIDTTKISLQEVPKNIGKPVLYFSEKDGLEIETIEMTELQGELGRTEVQIDYKKDGQPFLTMYVFETPADEIDLYFSDEESIEIRHVKGTFIDEAFMRLLAWQEDGLSYSVDLIDPNLTFEDVVKMADDMELIE